MSQMKANSKILMVIEVFREIVTKHKIQTFQLIFRFFIEIYNNEI